MKISKEILHGAEELHVKLFPESSRTWSIFKVMLRRETGETWKATLGSQDRKSSSRKNAKQLLLSALLELQLTPSHKDLYC